MRTNFEKTLFLTDLDGTLLTPEIAVSDYTVKTLNRLIENGMNFSFATARSYESSYKLVSKIQFSLPFITYNGAFLVESKTGTPQKINIFSLEEIKKISAALKQWDIPCLVYAIQNGRETVSYHTHNMNSGLKAYIEERPNDPRMTPVIQGESLENGECFYFTCIGKYEKLMPVYEQIQKINTVRSMFQKDIYSGDYWLEIMPQKATKSDMAQELKRIYGFEKLVVFGDAINDLPMFQTADYCCAMENAVPELKEIADIVLESNKRDGVARFLENYSRLI